MQRRILKILAITLGVGAVLVATFFFADYVTENENVRAFVERTGYLGMLVISIIAGLNLFVPIPAGTFAPVYAAAGFPLPGIIAVLTIGTTIAGGIGYLIGALGKHVASLKYPKVQERIQTFACSHHALILPAVFLFASFSPLPNEVILIPLALAGIKFRHLLLPLIFGNLIYQTLYVYGTTSLFHYFF